MRKLASIKRINKILPHSNADTLELAYVDEWQVVVKKDAFKPGQLVVYFEIDSVLPEKPQYEFLRKTSYVNRPWATGFRLKMIRLRNEYSSGLVIPLNELDVVIENPREEMDVTDLLGVIKWEPHLPASLAGFARGDFPYFIKKTDQERLENLYRKIIADTYWCDFEETIKLDGSSCSFYIRDGNLGVCSRNLDLKVSDENKDNSFVKIANQYEANLREMCQETGHELCLQGEIMGPGIQGNREGFSDVKFFLYDIWDITDQKYISATDRIALAQKYGVPHVPVIDIAKSFYNYHTFAEFKEASDIPSINNEIAEGIVYKCVQYPEISFKVINNKYLMKEE